MNLRVRADDLVVCCFLDPFNLDGLVLAKDGPSPERLDGRMCKEF
jgi:hypothetical protein